MTNHGFPRFPKGSWEIWVSIQTTPPSCVQAYVRRMQEVRPQKHLYEAAKAHAVLGHQEIVQLLVLHIEDVRDADSEKQHSDPIEQQTSQIIAISK